MNEKKNQAFIQMFDYFCFGSNCELNGIVSQYSINFEIKIYTLETISMVNASSWLNRQIETLNNEASLKCRRF